MGKSVTYNDKLHFNYLIGKAIIENKKYTLLKEDIQNLQEINPKIDYTNFIESTFKGIYYLPNENRWLDKVTNNIVSMNHYHGKELEFKKALAYYALFQSSLIKRPFNLFHRKNLNIRTAEVERKFGNKATWEVPFKDYLLKFANEGSSLVFDSKNDCKAINKSMFDINPYGYDLIYLDPPYLRQEGSNESSNYLKCYHFLEGLSNYKNWSKLIDYDTRNLKLKSTSDEADFSKESIYETFEEILNKFIKSTIVVSYKKGGIPSIEFIKKTMEKMGKKVHTRSMHFIML